MKKSVLLSLALCLLSLPAWTLSFTDCLTEFSMKFDEIDEEYRANLDRCRTALSEERCLREANAIYGSKIDKAAKEGVLQKLCQALKIKFQTVSKDNRKLCQSLIPVVNGFIPFAADVFLHQEE